MVEVIVLANLAVIFAFLAGANMDISPLMTPTEGRWKLFSAITAIVMCTLVIVEFSSSK